MMYQVRLEAVKKWCHKNNEDCNDTRARTIELTEEQYLTYRVEWSVVQLGSLGLACQILDF